MLTPSQSAIRTTCLSIAGNIVLAIAKWIAGFFGNSYALIADAIESVTDIFSSVLVLFGLKYATRPADANHPYGHGRAEPLITFLVVLILMVSAFVIAHDSIVNIQRPHETPRPYTLLVIMAVIVLKEILYRYTVRKSKETNSSSLKADAWHHRSDAITSVAAFIGIGIALVFGKGYEAADDWAALLASVFILYNSYLILRPALGEVMDEQIHYDIENEIRQVATEVNGVIDTEKCFVRKSGMQYFVDLHVVVASDISVNEGHEISHELKRKVQTEMPEIANVLIHIEPFQSS